MFLYEYIIKLLMGNSNTIFIGLIIVIFGYLGWLLKSIYEQVEVINREKDNQKDILEIIREKIEKLDENIYRNILEKLNDNLNCLRKIYSELEDNDLDLKNLEADIISEIKEESDEIKEIIKILMTRSFNKEAKGDVTDRNSGEDIVLQEVKKDNSE